MHPAEGDGVGGVELNGIHRVASPRLAAATAAPSTSSVSVPATIVINAASPAPVRALPLAPRITSPEGVAGDPTQISATRLLELMSGKQQSPKNEAERDILVREGAIHVGRLLICFVFFYPLHLSTSA